MLSASLWRAWLTQPANAPAVAAAGTLAIAKAPVVSINAILVEHVEFIPDPVHDGPHDLIEEVEPLDHGRILVFR